MEISLDDIYLPLRLKLGFADTVTDKGLEYSHIALLSRTEPLVVRGVAGAGKTTWLRWNFRRLLFEDSALPIMIELRRLAGSWQNSRIRVHRSLDGYIDEFIAEQMGDTWRGYIRSVLQDKDAPLPILLVDGWDELGTLGEDFRHKLLGFMQENKRVKVIVTSRPYGEARPSSSDGFDILDIQPLSDEEIMRLATRFFELSCKDDELRIPYFIERFSVALKRSPEALSLVRTALLLTMMLMISKSSPLPDKRHLLYQKCVDVLLNAVPDRKQEEGALFARDQWRPDDSEERLRVVASLAFHIQEKGYEKTGRGAIVRKREELLAFLPESWSPTEREYFINWLLGATGLLIDRADESLAFAHLSFQEFLTAWFLHTTVEGDSDRVTTLQQFSHFEGWWETLRLWVALVNGQRPAKLNGVIEPLFSDLHGLSLAGAIFADGSGPDDAFQSWFLIYLKEIAKPWSPQITRTSFAWASSRQQPRKEWMIDSIRIIAPAQRWREWIQIRSWARTLGIDASIPLPQTGTLARFLVEAQHIKEKGEEHVAVGRVLSSGVPVWQTDSWESFILFVWPSRRRLLGHTLQALAVLGYDRDEIISFVQKSRRLTDRFDPFILTRNTQLSPSDLEIHVSQKTADAVAVNLEVDWALQPLAEEVTGYHSIERFAEAWAAHIRGNNLGHWFDRFWAKESANSYISQTDLAFHAQGGTALDCDRLRQFPQLLLGPMGVLAYIAYVEPERINQVFNLLRHAARIALNPKMSAHNLKRELHYSSQLDPLWTSLARHLAFRSSYEDIQILQNAAANPFSRTGTLGWSLQYIVRGDILLPDGSRLTIDEITSLLGRPALPFIEPYPSLMDPESELVREWGPKVANFALRNSAIRIGFSKAHPKMRFKLRNS